jgi:hypothetical protein
MDRRINHTLLKASGIVALVMIGAALICGIFELTVLGMKNSLDYLGAGKRWSADGTRYAVIGMYAEENAGISADQAETWARSVDSALLEASVTPNEGARSWAWTYGCDAVLPVSGTKATVNAETLAVSGDFFVFHQLAFKYGSGFLNDNSNPMGVVLDRDLAWRVYGAENIVGMTVTIGSEEYTIVGITDRESSSGAYKKAYGDTPRMYMSYRGYQKISGGAGNISFFEAALPNSVRGFAMNIFSGRIHVNEDSSSTIEATDRFSLKKRFDNMKELAYAWVSINKIEFPYWENEARVCDYRAAVMMLFEVAFAAVAGSSLILSFILLRASGWTLIGTLKQAWTKAADERARRKREKPPKAPKVRKKRGKEEKPAERENAPENGERPTPRKDDGETPPPSEDEFIIDKSEKEV